MPNVPNDSRYLEPEIELASRDKMRAIQEEKFLAQVNHAAANSAFYQHKLKQAGVSAGDIRSLDDIGKLPFTTKDEIKQSQAEHPLWGEFLAVPLEQCSRLHLTSATTGRPVAMLDTAEDWYGFYHSYARGLWGMGIRPSDMVMTAFSFGPWIGFWSGFFAAQELGCLMFPNGGMSTDQRIDAMLTYPITVLGCTPSYALYLAEQARSKGIDLAKESKLRITWHTGEPGAGIPATKKKIEEGFGAKCMDLPGLTEMLAWGFECEFQSGLVHVHEDYVYPEVLDPDTLQPVGPGEHGELILTNLYRKAMPFLRYRTRDLVKVPDRQCPCGRTLFSLEGGVLGRLDDMKKIRGVIVYPRRIEEIVRQYEGVDEFRVLLVREGGLDEIIVELDLAPHTNAKSVVGEVSEALRIGLGIRCKVKDVESGSLPRWDHKARRVVDQRTEVPF